MLFFRIVISDCLLTYFKLPDSTKEVVFEYPKHNIVINGIFIYSTYKLYFETNSFGGLPIRDIEGNIDMESTALVVDFKINVFYSGRFQIDRFNYSFHECCCCQQELGISHDIICDGISFVHT